MADILTLDQCFFCSLQYGLEVALGFHYCSHWFSIRVVPIKWGWKKFWSPLDINCITPQWLLPGPLHSGKRFDQWWWPSVWNELLMKRHQATTRENEVLLRLGLQFVLSCEVFADYFRVWLKINQLIVYQGSVYLKESEIGKAIVLHCSEVSCVMQLVMTTKLMVLRAGPKGFGAGQTHESNAILGAQPLPKSAKCILISLLKSPGLD